ncbi:hypothetical protein [Methanoregula formicica]|uniref:Uncharacterized protein n=1 Tax=Methanoregula formicica (strain DSM 22288 / NBRC 105244 / SMSP) TaxID=593750 RepID=L0HIZ4_METFS|nr:hypothetical protein [Methanoregula formicica]AGB03273.1 hypothetical protein Metfor_2268 [Methanoregula formicica SMSP]
MEDSSRNPSETGSPTTIAGLRNGLEEQQEILNRLSQKLDDYFALRGFGKNE